MKSAICCAALIFSSAAAQDQALPHYRPQPVSLDGRPYMTPEGEVAVIGYNDMEECLTALNRVFFAAHPDVRFHMVLQGTRTAPAALTQGVSAFAPMGAEFTDSDLLRYRAANGADPLVFRVAHDSLNPRAKSAPLAIFVHKDNPLTSITIDQAARIFSVRLAGDQIDRWVQLGGADMPIHPAGLNAETALSLFLQRHKFHGRPFLPSVAGFPQSADVVRQVGEDPQAIGFAAMNQATPQVKILAIAERPGDPPSAGSAEDVVTGRYPLDRVLYIYARQPLDPLVHDYLNLVLSFEGQSVIAAGSLGYLPLNATELAAERAKLD